ncbi:MAG: histidine--tRNA ligase [Alphaproteobacteria bacterium]|nr:histidine--tRNA ligase [Alphaproteobacteria bacterium]
MKQKVTPKTLSGFMELLPAEQLVFDRMKNIIEETYRSFGFVGLDTPVLELSDVLLAKAGGETEKQIYRFTKGDNDLCMRFDLTVPLARYVAEHQNELTFPFKRYQISKCYRGERPQKGRFREFYQADIDIIGSEKLAVVYDAEVPSIMYHVLKKLGLERFHIKLNNRKVMIGFFESLNLSEKSSEILRIIDKADKIGFDNVKACLKDLALSDEMLEVIMTFAMKQGTVAEILDFLKKQEIENEKYKEGVAEIELVCEAMKNLGVDENAFEIDLKITRGLDYYTGTVYETFLDDYKNWGSICSGGRYDNLSGYYTDRKLPGVGMSIGLTRFFDLLKDQNLIQPKAQTPADVLVLPMGDEALLYALKVANSLREKGFNVQTNASDGKFKNKMVYANKIGVPFVVILGEDEVQSQTVTLKNMQTGDQSCLSYEQLPVELKNVLSENSLKTTKVIRYFAE